MNHLISEITGALFGTPTDSDKKRNPSAADNKQDNNGAQDEAIMGQNKNEEEAEEQAITVPPRRSFVRSNAVRARSLSRVYNNVPRGRPTAREAQMDLIEYYAHLAVMETDADRIRSEDKHLREALQGCSPRQYGRLYSRLQIACLAISTGVLAAPEQPDPNDNDGEETEEEQPTFTSAALWKTLHQQVKLVKELLLRKDANTFVPVQRHGYSDDEAAEDADAEDTLPIENDVMDTELAKHEMFQDAYREILVLLRVQVILATFCEQVTSNRERAVQTYEKDLRSLFQTVGAIPEELVEKVLAAPQQITKLLQGALSIIEDEESVYSYAQLKIKMKGVLTKWAESILEIPTLVQLGYGGVMSILSAEEDDVSSYGVDEDQLLTQKPLTNDVDTAPDIRQRRTSFAELPNSRRFPTKQPRTSMTHGTVPDANNLPSKAPRNELKNTENKDADANGTTQETYSTPQKRRRSRTTWGYEDDDDDEDGGGAVASKRPRNGTSGHATLDDLWEDSIEKPKPKPVRTYLDWTEDETNAVREGYLLFGKKWAMIKHNSNHRLSRRTNVQIKDKFRTMVKRGEIQEATV